MEKHQSLLHAIKWAYTATWGERGFSAIFTLILASMLGPEAFGILSIGLIYITFLQMFLDQGFASAIVQKKDLSREHLDAVFWAQLVLSILLMGVSISLSRWWAEVNHSSQVASVIAILSLSLPIDAFAIIPRTLLAREMDYKSLAVRSNIAVLLGGAIGILMAVTGFGIWSLVGQQISKELAKVVLLWILHPWRPKFEFSWIHLRALMGFSTSQFVGQLASFVDSQAASIVLGIFLGPIAVGLYRLAERLMGTVIAVGTSSIQWVSFPEFSRFQDNPEQLRKSTLTCIRLSSAITLPVLAGLAAVSSPLMLALGPKWVPAADLVKVLSLLGIVLSFTFFTSPLLQALGKPRFAALWDWTGTIVGLVVLCVTAFVVRGDPVSTQIMGIGIARLLCASLFVMPVFLWLLMKYARLGFADLLSSIMPSVLCSICLVLAVAAIHRVSQLAHVGNILLLVLESCGGAIVGIAVLFSLDTKLRTALLRLG